MKKRILAAVGLIVLLTGCSTPGSDNESPEPRPAETTETSEPQRTEVDWSNLPTEYQRIIDEETAEKDCAALQEIFDAAPDRSDLLAYIDEALQEAGCY